MKTIFVALLCIPSLALCEQAPEFLLSLPINTTQSILTSKIANEWYEFAILDGKPAYRHVRDGKFITTGEYNELSAEDRLFENHSRPVAVKIIEDAHAPPIIEPDNPRQIIEISSPMSKTNLADATIAIATGATAAAKKAPERAVSAFKAIPDKVEDLAEILPLSIQKNKVAKSRFDPKSEPLDETDFLNKLIENAAKPGKIIKTEKKIVPTAEQLEVMKQFGLSCPPRLTHLDGTITEGISITIPCGECQNGACQTSGRYESVECESCRVRRLRR